MAKEGHFWTEHSENGPQDRMLNDREGEDCEDNPHDHELSKSLRGVRLARRQRKCVCSQITVMDNCSLTGMGFSPFESKVV